MQFFVRFDVQQPSDMSRRELVEIWDREADAALGAMDAGVLTHVWKVSGQRTVLAVAEFPDCESLDRALAGLPIIQEMGGAVTTQAWPIYPYRTFAADMKEELGG